MTPACFGHCVYESGKLDEMVVAVDGPPEIAAD
jgi:hypothetical protein